jgi:hypothetical protein
MYGASKLSRIQPEGKHLIRPGGAILLSARDGLHMVDEPGGRKSTSSGNPPGRPRIGEAKQWGAGSTGSRRAALRGIGDPLAAPAHPTLPGTIGNNRFMDVAERSVPMLPDASVGLRLDSGAEDAAP